MRNDGRSRSQAGHERWMRMSPEMRQAHIDYLNGVWSTPGTRERLSITMRANWEDYHDDQPRHDNLLRRLHDAYVRDGMERG